MLKNLEQIMSIFSFFWSITEKDNFVLFSFWTSEKDYFPNDIYKNRSQWNADMDQPKGKV